MFRKQISIIMSLVLLFAFSPRVVASGGIAAKGYVLIEGSTGRVIAGGNENAKLPMASTTKIMTALIALEQENIDEYFEVDAKAIMTEGTSMGLKTGDKATLRVLATGMLLPSGNDAANAAAVKISGSIPEFAKLMNARASQLNMKNTSFVTPSGLNHDNHYSSAYDMALLAREALKNDDFKEICGSIKSQVEYGNPPYKRYLTNHNRLLKEYDGCIGMKTGFTKKAGRCLVSAASRDGVTLICVTLGASNDWQVHKNLFDQGFKTTQKTEVKSTLDKLSIKVVGGENNKINVAINATETAPITPEDVKGLSQQIFLDRFYYAPIKKGDVVGEVKHYLDGQEIASTTLVAGESVNLKPYVEKKSKWQKIKAFFGKT